MSWVAKSTSSGGAMRAIMVPRSMSPTRYSSSASVSPPPTGAAGSRACATNPFAARRPASVRNHGLGSIAHGASQWVVPPADAMTPAHGRRSAVSRVLVGVRCISPASVIRAEPSDRRRQIGTPHLCFGGPINPFAQAMGRHGRMITSDQVHATASGVGRQHSVGDVQGMRNPTAGLKDGNRY